MGYVCSVCLVQLPTIWGLCTHLHLIHGKNALTVYKCGQAGCLREYDSTRSFKKHLRKQHPDDGERDVAGGIPDDPAPDPGPIPGEPNEAEDNEPHQEAEGRNVAGRNENVMNDVGVVEFRNIVFRSALALSAKLYSSSTLNRMEVQNSLNHVQEFSSSSYLDVIKFKTLSVLRQSNAPLDQIENVAEMFSVMGNAFEGLETEHLRMAVMAESECFIGPQQYEIGVGEIQRHVNGNLVLEEVALEGQFISMKKVLKTFLQLPGVFAAIESNVADLKASQKFCNFIQGSLWKHIEETHFEDKKVLPLFMYYDDVESGSDLSSHSGEYKIGAVYYQIPCIPQYLTSCLKFIFVAAIFLSTDRCLNNGAAFSRIIDELLDLERDGLHIVTETGQHQVYFSLGLILGDNLGQNQMGGFVESFTANFFCRFCKEHKRTTHHQLRENVQALRNRINFQQDLLVNDPSLTGIKFECRWNRLQSFHVTENMSVDIMHDLFEGVCHYVLCPILKHLVLDRIYFTIDTLNDRVQNFDYAKTGGKKPPVIRADRLRAEKLKMSAAEMMFFVTHLGIMIGDLIPEDDEIWALYKLHVKIIDILRCPYARRNELQYLAALISDHHVLYCRLFNQTLKPKFHFMIHYARLILLFGPLVFIWSMRMEGKHRPVVKLTSDNTTCRKNLPLTLALRYSFSLCGDFLLNSGFPQNIIYHNREMRIGDCGAYQHFQHLLPANHENNFIVKEVEMLGTVYAKDGIVVLDYVNNEPLFGKIQWIVKQQNNYSRPLLILSGLDTVGFDDHLHAFMIRETPEWYCVEQTNLEHFHTTVAHTGANGELYVVFPHAL